MPQMLLMTYIMTYVVDECSIPQYDKPIFLRLWYFQAITILEHHIRITIDEKSMQQVMFYKVKCVYVIYALGIYICNIIQQHANMMM